MKTLITLLFTATLVGGVAIAAKTGKKSSAKAEKPATCMNEYGCQLDEKCVKYAGQKQGFCSRNTNGSAPSAFVPPPTDGRKPVGRDNCSIAAAGQCIKP